MKREDKGGGPSCLPLVHLSLFSSTGLVHLLCHLLARISLLSHIFSAQLVLPAHPVHSKWGLNVPGHSHTSLVSRAG